MTLYGKELMRLRRLHKISRVELARRSGISRNTIFGIEKLDKDCKFSTMVELFDAIDYKLIPVSDGFAT